MCLISSVSDYNRQHTRVRPFVRTGYGMNAVRHPGTCYFHSRTLWRVDRSSRMIALAMSLDSISIESRLCWTELCANFTFLWTWQTLKRSCNYAAVDRCGQRQRTFRSCRSIPRSSSDDFRAESSFWLIVSACSFLRSTLAVEGSSSKDRRRSIGETERRSTASNAQRLAHRKIARPPPSSAS